MHRKHFAAFAPLVVFFLASKAQAFEVVGPKDVPGLKGKTVWIETACSARQEKPFVEVELFVGQEVTVVGKGRIDAWAQVKDKEGRTLDVMLEHLSKSKPAYSMLETGKLEEFLPKVFAEAYGIPDQLAELWKSHDYDLDKDREAQDARTAYEQAFKVHKNLVFKLVHGRESKQTVLGDKKYEWLWKADKSVLEAYCEGMTYLDEWKKSPFMTKAEKARDLLNSVGSIAESAGNIMMAKSELKQKYWLKGLSKDAPQAQKDALDREETESRQKKIAELEKQIVKAREDCAKERKALGF